MSGFFSDDDFMMDKRAEVLNEPMCRKCGLYKTAITPKMGITGKGRKKVLIIAEAPGKNEDEQGVQLVGEAGQLLRRKLSKKGFNLDRDFKKINSVNCRPTKGNANRPPTAKEIKCCRPYVKKIIEQEKPKIIWLFGGVAVKAFYDEYIKAGAITKWRGLCIPDREREVFVFPMYHPSYILRNDRDANLASVFDRDIDYALSKIDWCLNNYSKVFSKDKKNVVHCLYTPDEITKVLSNIKKRQPMFLSFDYETTGLKPFKDGHKIVSMSVCCDSEVAYSFPYDHKVFGYSDKDLLRIKMGMRRLLTSKDVMKSAHNLQFEHTWTMQTLGFKVINWGWDSQLAAHILDNRREYTSLDFQVMTQLGRPPYNEKIKPFIGSKNSMGFNRMEEADPSYLLLYGGNDSLYQYQLMQIQRRQVRKEKQKWQLKFFMEAAEVLSEIHQIGICVNEEYYHNLTNKDGTGVLDKEAVDLMVSIMKSYEWKKFKKLYDRDPDIASDDMVTILYDICKLDRTDDSNLTDKGNPKTDKEILNKVGTKFCKDVIALRELHDKIINTYITGFKRETHKGRMHPFYYLNIPVSFRSSSADPNFQNIPVRQKKAKKYVRGGIIPSKGHCLVESDFGGVEVTLSACNHKDPNMITYLTDKSTDMHRDTAADLWKLHLAAVSKDIRFYAKNDWVFAEFYGDWYGSCAPNLWNDCLNLKLNNSDATIKDHIKSVGIKNYDQFLEHCKEVERKFWEERFPVYNKWKQEIQEVYRELGYIESLFGFKFRGYMGKNEATNYPIQSAAFHCLLWTMINVFKTAKEEGWRSKMIGQIHDCLLHDTHPSELKHVMATIDRVGTVDIRKRFDFIIVPLVMEHEICPINQPWSTKMDIEDYWETEEGRKINVKFSN
jgi:uracil-DNA glycosylase family 4